jgi:5-methylcytosine-specific restriction endonuclease McrA
MNILTCNQCGKEYQNTHKTKYCSRSCYYLHQKAYPNKGVYKNQGMGIVKQCMICKTSFEWFSGVKKIKKYCSQPCYYEMKRVRKDRVKLTEEMRERIRLSKLGSNNPQWRGGTSPERDKARKTRQYREWRTAVFQRDNYTCQFCGVKSGMGKRVNFNADHIIPWWQSIEKRFDLSNGQTLCETCHRIKTSEEQKKNWINQYATAR